MVDFNFKYMYTYDEVRELDLNMKIGPAVTNFSQVNTYSASSLSFVLKDLKDMHFSLNQRVEVVVKWCKI